MTWLPKKSVVVPIDFSESSLQAVDVARQFVDDAAKLHVVHVVQPIHVVEPGMLWGTITDESRLEMSKKALQEHFAKDDGIQCYTVLGDPAHEIRDLALKVSAELVVIPSHGRSGFRRVLLGSVTEKVLRLVDCPVLVLRTGQVEAE